MKFNEYTEKLGLLKKLILAENTGTPTELAKKLKVSERTCRRLVELLKEQNLPVAYNRKSKTYFFKE